MSVGGAATFVAPVQVCGRRGAVVWFVASELYPCAVYCSVFIRGITRRNRHHRRPRRHRGGVRHRRSAEEVGRRQLRAQRQAQYVMARRLALRSVRRVWLGTQARLVFDRTCALAEAPDLLRDAMADLASRLGGTAHQMFTSAGSPEVKDAKGRHLCRHRWRSRLGGRELALSLSAHKQMGGNRPYLWIQGSMLLVRRVAYMFRASD